MKNKKQSRGLSLIEVIISLAILALAVGGPLSTIARDTQENAIVKDKIVAEFLLQETVETIRAIRDGNQIKKLSASPPPSWHPFVGDGNRFAPKITGSALGTIPLCTEGSMENISECEKVCEKPNSDFYYTQGEADCSGDGRDNSKYRRFIKVDSLKDKEVIYTVTVRWDGQSGSCESGDFGKKCVDLKVSIFDHKNRF